MSTIGQHRTSINYATNWTVISQDSTLKSTATTFKSWIKAEKCNKTIRVNNPKKTKYPSCQVKLGRHLLSYALAVHKLILMPTWPIVSMVPTILNTYSTARQSRLQCEGFSHTTDEGSNRPTTVTKRQSAKILPIFELLNPEADIHSFKPLFLSWFLLINFYRICSFRTHRWHAFGETKTNTPRNRCASNRKLAHMTSHGWDI